jgi:hypothetical protein
LRRKARNQLLDGTDEGINLTLTHSGLMSVEAAKHSLGWPHFLGRLVEVAEDRNPGPDPWKIEVQ